MLVTLVREDAVGSSFINVGGASSVASLDSSAFVIMQVGKDESPERKRADEVFTYIIKPVLDEFGISAHRADLDPSPGSVTPKMLGDLLGARLVIADLTGRNPNVFYELGITHSFARPLVCLADTPNSLPFDTQDERIIPIGLIPESGLPIAQAEKVKELLRQSLRVVLAEGYEPPSPVRQAAGAQSLDALAPDNPVAAQLEQLSTQVDRLTMVTIDNIEETRRRTTVTPAMKADLYLMREFIESLAEMNRLTPSDLDRLKSRKASHGQHKWVTQLGSRLVGPDDPWSRSTTAGSADPWAADAKSADPWTANAQSAADPWASSASSSTEPDPWTTPTESQDDGDATHRTS